MIAKTITYTNLEDETKTETFYFHLTKADMLEMDVCADGGMEAMMNDIMKTKNGKGMLDVIKDYILRSYGEKNPVTSKFEKKRDGRKLADDFEQSEAYSELLVELATDDKAFLAFIMGILPQKISEAVAQTPQFAAIAKSKEIVVTPEA